MGNPVFLLKPFCSDRCPKQPVFGKETVEIHRCLILPAVIRVVIECIDKPGLPVSHIKRIPVAHSGIEILERKSGGNGYIVVCLFDADRLVVLR